MATRSSPSIFDPICGMWLEPDYVIETYTYIGHTYGFCSLECRDLFAQSPDAHVLRLSHDLEACIAHCCPLQRDEVGADEVHTRPPLHQVRQAE